MIDRIEYNVVQSENYVKAANTDTKQAVRFQSAARRVSWTTNDIRRLFFDRWFAWKWAKFAMLGMIVWWNWIWYRIFFYSKKKICLYVTLAVVIAIIVVVIVGAVLGTSL